MDTTYPVVITVDGNTYNFTQDSLAEYIKRAEARKSDIDAAHNEMSSAFRQISNLRNAVYSFFNERHSSGDTELTADVSDINELLDEIGSNKLNNIYSATVTITITVDDIEASDEDDVTQAIEDELQVDVGMFTVTVDNVNVEHIYER